jgi:hypothetical protein
MTIGDDDPAGMTVTPVDPQTVAEGSSQIYVIQLRSHPLFDVQVSVAPAAGSDDERLVMPSAVTIAAGSWQTPRTLTVATTNDLIHQGTTPARVLTFTPASTDGNFVEPVDRSLTITDDDVLTGMTVTPCPAPADTEGASVTFTIHLQSQPLSNVDVSVGPAAGTDDSRLVMPAPIHFTAANWQTSQTLVVSTLDDGIVQTAMVVSQLVFTGSSSDPNFQQTINCSVTIYDNEPVTMDPDENTDVELTEPSIGHAGPIQNYTIRLRTQPTANVVVSVVSEPPIDSRLALPLQITIGTADWDSDHTLTVEVVRVPGNQGTMTSTLNFVLTSDDGRFSRTITRSVTVYNSL